MRKTHTTNTNSRIDFPNSGWPFPVAIPLGGPALTAQTTATNSPVDYKVAGPGRFKITTVQDDMRHFNIKICHGYDSHHNRGGVTIAYRKTSGWKNTRMVEVALAYCSPHDSFNKKIGTELAVDRFLNQNTVLVPVRLGSDNTIVGNLLSMFYYDVIA